MNSTINQRIREIIEDSGKTITSYASIIGVSQPTLKACVDGSNKPSYDTIQKILISNPMISAEWLLRSEGEKYKSDIQIINVPKATEMKLENQDIILYDIEAAANLKTLFASRNQNILGKLSIPDMPKCDGAVFVTGDSMYPLLKSGDIIAYKILHDWANHIIFGEMYLVSFDIEGDEFLVVKYVNRSEKEGCVKLVSYNTHHDPMDILIGSINDMALVKFSIRKNVMR